MRGEGACGLFTPLLLQGKRWIQGDFIVIRNIIFDFGNVIGRFDEAELTARFCPEESERTVFQQAVFHDWASLDAGKTDYEAYIARAMEQMPTHLHRQAQALFRDWCSSLPYVEGMPELIAQLKAAQIPLYLLSNAPVCFAEQLELLDVMRGFSGAVVSGPLQMVKPEPGIYEYLLARYHLPASECLFIDDRAENIEAALRCGLEGYLFDGDVARLRAFLIPRLGI